MRKLGSDMPASKEIEAPPSLPIPQRKRWAWLRHPSPALRQALILFGTTRLLLILVTYFGYILFTAGKYSTTTVGGDNLLLSWDRWDARWYLGIAERGYFTIPQTAFFPLYPLLVRLGSLPLWWAGDAGTYAVGLVISNLAFLFALWALHVLAERECGPEAAARATLYMALFPTALYFFAPYSESLFLLLVLAFFLALRQERWLLAGALGFFAALTRNSGFLLMLPFAVEYLNRHGWHWRGVHRDAWAVALIPLGLGLYSGYCLLRFEDPLAFSHVVQVHWGRVLSWPWVGVVDQVSGFFAVEPVSFFRAHNLLDLGAIIGALALLIAGWRRLPLSYSLYGAALLMVILLFPLTRATGFLDPLESDQRYILQIFPIFLTLGLLVRRPATHQALVIAFSGMLAVLSLVFITGRWLV